MVNFDNYRRIKPQKLQVGDIVQIKSWASMHQKFSEDGDGDLVVGTNYFTKDMKRFCKLYYIVGEIVYHDMRGGTLFKLKHGGLNPNEDLDRDLDLCGDWLGLEGGIYYFNIAMLSGLRPPKSKPKPKLNKVIQSFDKALL